MAGVLSILAFPFPAFAQTQTDSGTIDLTTTVPGAPPASAPTINQPASNQTFQSKNITVSGSCINGLIVKIFSNSIFVGSTTCQASNTFSLPIDLFVDRNDLVARQYDFANQASPDSATVTVFYIPPSSQPATPGSQVPAEQVAKFQLVIDADYTAYGLFVNQPFKLPIHFLGGSPAYTVTVDWGDGSSNNFVRQTTDKFSAEYEYTRAGLYNVVIKVVDSTGQQAYLQFVVIVHGKNQQQSQGPVDQLVSCFKNVDWSNPVFSTTAFSLFISGVGVGSLFTLWIRRNRSKNLLPPDESTQ